MNITKNPAYGRHWISWLAWILASIPEKEEKKHYKNLYRFCDSGKRKGKKKKTSSSFSFSLEWKEGPLWLEVIRTSPFLRYGRWIERHPALSRTSQIIDWIDPMGRFSENTSQGTFQHTYTVYCTVYIGYPTLCTQNCTVSTGHNFGLAVLWQCLVTRGVSRQSSQLYAELWTLQR